MERRHYNYHNKIDNSLQNIANQETNYHKQDITQTISTISQRNFNALFRMKNDTIPLLCHAKTTLIQTNMFEIYIIKPLTPKGVTGGRKTGKDKVKRKL